MSSFIGHSIPAISLYFSAKSLYQLSIYRSNYRWLWLIWLVLIAWTPDLDHFVPSLHASAHQGLRITHSIFGSLLLPCYTILILISLRIRGRKLAILSAQLVLAALSHLVFDMLTGSMRLPLLYPFSLYTFKLPFGLLPSAGSINFSNYYFYRNLLIEMGILLPIFFSIHLLLHQPLFRHKYKATIALSLICSLCFMVWAAMLSR
ncbi:MAG: metal-dependent hydrolase [Stenomitos rutilans HA7619-LM2]|jgi:hypothetical protein|nr:metal-dependent hydrolase [Stenomitos rutilans HA7619-LM2]